MLGGTCKRTGCSAFEYACGQNAATPVACRGTWLPKEKGRDGQCETRYVSCVAVSGRGDGNDSKQPNHANERLMLSLV
jgi:hypothetical protein